VAVDQPVLSAQVLVEDEVFAQEPDRLDRIGVELARAADRLPVAPQIIAHRRAGADLGEDAVSFCAQRHGASPPVGLSGATTSDVIIRESGRSSNRKNTIVAPYCNVQTLAITGCPPSRA
jgi:hypothetical protein